MPRKKGYDNPGDNPEENQEHVFGQDEWGVVKDGEYAETSGLGPCLGIVIYDRKGNKALIGHFTTPNHAKGMEPMLARIKRFKDKSRLEVYLGGCGPMRLSLDTNISAETRKHMDIRDTRQYVLDQLAECGIPESHITVKWSTFADQSSVVSVDTKTGEVKIDIQDHIDESGASDDEYFKIYGKS